MAISQEPDGRPNLFGLSVSELAERLAPLDPRPFTGNQVATHLYARRARTFDQMTDLSAALRARLDSDFRIEYPQAVEARESTDGTIRYVLELPAGGRVEAVYLPAPGVRGPRVTLCISSQAGCALGCTFCMTASLGLLRNLHPGEIAGQVALLMQKHRLEPNRFNIVMMGMGEPLHNYDAVLRAIALLSGERTGFGIALPHITVSTVGLVPAIERLAREEFAPRLAVSLNATTDAVRSEIMPINKTWPIARLMEACRRFLEQQTERLTLEYVMLAGVNDTDRDLPRLARLASSLPARVNLIPFNATPELPFDPTPLGRIQKFRDGLVAAGVAASIRASRGRDVRAACGQLAFGARGESRP